MRVSIPERFLRSVAAGPWAVYEPKAEEIMEFLEFRADGGVRSEAELREIAGHARDPMQERGGGNGVAVIHLFGLIAHRMSGLEAMSGGASLEHFRKQFQQALQNDEIGTIVLHVDSPGGSVDGVAETSDMIYEARGKKRIVAVGDTLIASAAYAIASAADEIVLTKSGMVGSIGVIAVHFEFSEMEKAAGVATTVFTAGRFKGEGNRHEPLTEDARSHIQETVDDFYKQFIDGVARNRAMAPEQVKSGMGQGRALTAERALAEKLIDRIATYDEVLDDLGVSRSSRIERRASTEEVPVSAEAARIHADAEPSAEASEVTEETTAAAGDATEPKTENPETETPHGEEAVMPGTATAPQAGAGPSVSVDDVRKEESKRAQDIATMAHAHGMGDRASSWIEQNKSADWVGREILRLKSDEVAPTASAQPDEERRSAAVIRRRSSSAEEKPGTNFARFIMAYAAGGGQRSEAERWAKDQGYLEISAAMNSSTFASGGAMVPENYVPEVIELLRPASAIRSLNPMMVPLDGGNLSMPKLTGGATAAYKGEGQRGSTSEATTGRMHLIAKELIALVPITNQLLRRASPSAEMTVRDDTISALAQRSDLAFIRGDGTEHTPKGLRYLAAAGNVIPANATVNLANVTTDLGLAVLALEESDVRMIRPGWVFAPRIKHYLMTVRDGNGNYAFRDEMLEGNLWGYPFAGTSQIPTNLGGGTESEVYFADFADVVVGEEENLQVDIFREATYWDGSAWQSAMQNNEVVLRVVAEHDINLRHDESVAVLTAVKWGA